MGYRSVRCWYEKSAAARDGSTVATRLSCPMWEIRRSAGYPILGADV
nr:MAG TPA: hypothetical protein [Caudoviricetes sp.]